VSGHNRPIASIRLARSLPRLLAWPIALLVLAGTAGAGAAVLGGTPALALLALAIVLAVVGIGWAIRLLSVRLDVEEAEVRLHWIGGERRYPLSPGPVTRVRFRGENASRLRVRSAILGYGLGRARLRDEEEIHVVRLAPTPTAILVPTEEGRLAIAASDEPALLDALSRAARARQRLDELAREAAASRPAVELEVDEEEESDAAQAPAHAVAEPPERAGAEPSAADAASAEPEARPMTGIERMLYERRLADERAAAEAAEAEAEAEAEAALAALALAEQEAAAAAAMPAPVGTADSADAAAREVRPRGPVRPGRIRREQLRHAIALVPLAGAVAVWGIGTAIGAMPDPQTDTGRLTALALLLAGPGTAVGTIVARTWWPRIIGVVIVSGLATSILIGRALIGG
jgi:hypothetical protein